MSDTNQTDQEQRKKLAQLLVEEKAKFLKMEQTLIKGEKNKNSNRFKGILSTMEKGFDDLIKDIQSNKSWQDVDQKIAKFTRDTLNTKELDNQELNPVRTGLVSFLKKLSENFPILKHIIKVFDVLSTHTLRDGFKKSLGELRKELGDGYKKIRQEPAGPKPAKKEDENNNLGMGI